MTLPLLAFYGLGLVTLGFGFHFWRRFLRYRHFPKTSATLLSKKFVLDNSGESGVAYAAVVSFSYSVGSQTHTASNLYSLGTLGLGGAGGKSAIERTVRDLQPGSTIQVFYDPSNPSFAFNRNGPRIQIYFFLLMGVLFCVFGLLLHLKG